MDRRAIEAIMRRKKLSRKRAKTEGGMGAGKRQSKSNAAQPSLMHKSEKEPGWIDCSLPTGTGTYADKVGD